MMLPKQIFVFVWLVAIPVAGVGPDGGTNPRRFSEMSRDQLQRYLANHKTRWPDPTERLLAVSTRFVGVPYGYSPLGEGPGNNPDPDPLIRFDRVDCTTFVEQCMALARSESFQEALDWLQKIRYLHNRISYRQRKHFMMAQWLPENQRLGFLEDITQQVAGEQVVGAEKRMGPALWKKRRRLKKGLQLSPSEVPSGLFRLPVIPLGRVLKMAHQIPSGTLINVVRNNIETTPILVTHQGILTEKKGVIFLRHASKAGFHRVVDEPLRRFVSRNSMYRKWSVLGFNLQKIRVE
jgi:hypothetical protein